MNEEELKIMENVRGSVYDSIQYDIKHEYGKQNYEDFIKMLEHKGFQKGKLQAQKEFIEKLKERIKDVEYCQSQDKYQEQIDEDDIIISECKFWIKQLQGEIKEEERG